MSGEARTNDTIAATTRDVLGIAPSMRPNSFPASALAVRGRRRQPTGSRSRKRFTALSSGCCIASGRAVRAYAASGVMLAADRGRGAGRRRVSPLRSPTSGQLNTRVSGRRRIDVDDACPRPNKRKRHEHGRRGGAPLIERCTASPSSPRPDVPRPPGGDQAASVSGRTSIIGSTINPRAPSATRTGACVSYPGSATRRQPHHLDYRRLGCCVGRSTALIPVDQRGGSLLPARR